MVAEIPARLPSPEMPHVRHHPALKQGVGPRIVQIRLAVVLVVQDEVDFRQSLAEALRRQCGAGADSVGIAAKLAVSGGQIGIPLPGSRIEQPLQTRAVSTGLVSEDTPSRL